MINKIMKFELKLNINNAEEEISYLNDFINEHYINGLTTKFSETKAPYNATMDGNLLINSLIIFISEPIEIILKQIFTIFEKFFDTKKVEIEFCYKCNDETNEYKYVFTNTENNEKNYINFIKILKNNCTEL